VRTAYVGDGGAAHAAKGQVFVDMSTAGPEVSKEIATRLGAAGAQYVDAPGLGSIPAVEAGAPVLQALGEIRRVGGLGSAASLKLVANTMIAGVTALAAELLAAGASAGLNDDDVFFVLSRISPYLNTRRAGLVDHGYEPVTFALRDAAKDLRLATEPYKNIGATTPPAMRTKDLYERAAQRAGDLDMSAIASLHETRPVD